MQVMVFHPQSAGRMCYTRHVSPPWWEQPHCPTCACERSVRKPEHGHWVTCGHCNEPGIIPDQGHEAELFTAMGATVSEENGRLVVTLGQHLPDVGSVTP
jgi:hypothetical protein